MTDELRDLFSPSGQLLSTSTVFGRAIELHAVEPIGQSATTLDLLVRLSFSENESMRAVELCDQLLKSPGYVSRVIEQAEREGLVARTPDPRDGRAQLVTLTSAGRAVLDEFIPRARDVLNASIYDVLDASEVTELISLLSRVADAARELLAE